MNAYPKCSHKQCGFEADFLVGLKLRCCTAHAPRRLWTHFGLCTLHAAEAETSEILKSCHSSVLQETFALHLTELFFMPLAGKEAAAA